MSGGSAKPKRGKAAPASLQYEHGRRAEAQRKKREFACLGAMVIMLSALAFIVPMALADETWGDTVWGDLAPAWPGGAYAFAGTVGALVPVSLAALIAPLSRMNWKKNKVRSAAWAAAGVPGFALGWVATVTIFATFRPKHTRDWDADCYSEGKACWVHVHYPWLWAVGLLGTLVTAARMIAVAARLANRTEAPAT
ncbi:hypothetical protein [Streptomyces sp. NPDC002619]|uniref:hypothetical protein n=1 Tax=Streptomyces sp. NPDC002619 TaxID=3364655 RepID=UPI003680408E